MVNVETIYIYNVKTITLNTKQIENTKDKWVGDNNTNDEKNSSRYIKQELRL